VTTTTFEEFFKEHYTAVEAGVRASGARPDVAAEATQEAFVRAYPRWWRVALYRNPAAWVQRVAINVGRDLARSDKRRQAVVGSIEVEEDSPPVDGERFESAVSKLPPQQEKAVRAFYQDDLTTEETARRLGISPGAVRFHLSRARAGLRPLLASDTNGQEA
jgi:RNA polymerase sigma-70 factor (ECF subfamily)